ncbi:MAG: hypothetical protein PHU65_08310, partial [Actinomycetota bacterium]|nr:hypothetical protein [Actinomycetota bacterium]
MIRKLTILLVIALFLAISVLAGCSLGKTSQQQETAIAENANQEQTVKENQSAETSEAAGTTEVVQITEEEILFDFYSIPSD